MKRSFQSPTTSQQIISDVEKVKAFFPFSIKNASKMHSV
jgi:hypothetical protein